MSSAFSAPNIVSLSIASGALVLSVINYLEARETRVKWRVDRDGNKSVVRLFNESHRFTAVVQSITDPDAVNEDSPPQTYLANVSLPVTVEPGNWVSIVVSHYLGKPEPRIRIVWRQRRANGKWVRPYDREITLFG
jgi:hypothetical protein